MTTGTHGRLSGAQRREQLLDATKAIALEQGFHAVSIEAVARAAGITRPIVYGHFHDLAGLLEALVRREGERALGQLAAVLPRQLDDPRQALLAALRSYLDAVQADPGTWKLVLMPPEGAPAILRDQIALGRAAVVAQLAEVVGVGSIGSPDPELTARMLSTISDEAARLLLTDPATYSTERILAHAQWWLERFSPA